ncbi:MAG: phosphatidylserine decarboxylase family protein [Acidobacteria bacterium]|nr:phosphatidylserine decarboxylase family protein [Acidobacteriota bacterium]
MVRDGYRFAFPLFVVSVGLLSLRQTVWAAAVGLLTAFVCWFFRNPHRTIPQGAGLIVSPADGRIVQILELKAPGEEVPAARQVSIFMNIFNVHVNRAPVAGRLESLEYRRGRFKAAFEEEASRVNEQNVITIRSQETTVLVKQIAGLIARRVVCWKRPGEALERGEVIGLIRFGSRVDLVVPMGTHILVREGERVKGGSSVIGELV